MSNKQTNLGLGGGRSDTSSGRLVLPSPGPAFVEDKMNPGSWIKTYHKIRDWEWYSDANAFRVFMELLLIANWKESRFMGRVIKRGQAVCGRHSIAEKLRISPQSVRSAIKRLKSTSEITIETTNKFSIITICKWDTYQSTVFEINQQINQQINQPSTSNQPATNHILEWKKHRMEEEQNLLSGKPDVTKLQSETALKKQELITQARVLIAYLNETACRQYSEVDSHMKFIMGRLSETNGDIEGIKKMVSRQVARWKHDPKMSEYLRPSTLFNKTKFHEYYACRDMPANPEPGPVTGPNGNQNPASSLSGADKMILMKRSDEIDRRIQQIRNNSGGNALTTIYEDGEESEMYRLIDERTGIHKTLAKLSATISPPKPPEAPRAKREHKDPRVKKWFEDMQKELDKQYK